MVIDEGKNFVQRVLDGCKGSKLQTLGLCNFSGMLFSVSGCHSFSFQVFMGVSYCFVGPLLYFTPMRMLEAINISTKVVGTDWKIVLPCAIIVSL